MNFTEKDPKLELSLENVTVNKELRGEDKFQSVMETTDCQEEGKSFHTHPAPYNLCNSKSPKDLYNNPQNYFNR